MLLTEDQRDLQAVLREFMGATCTTERTLNFIESDADFDESLWRRITRELGLTSLMIAEQHGGAGASFAEMCVLAEEGGAALAPVPLLSACWATVALDVGRADAAEEHLTRIVDGATYVFAQPVVLAAWRHPSLMVDERGRVTGAIAQAAAGGEGVVALAQAPGGPALVVITPDAASDGLHLRKLRVFDPTRPQISIHLSDHPAQVIGIDSGSVSALRDRCYVLAGAESIGVMRHTLEEMIAYSKERFAFGRPIGSYQALKHQLVDHWITLECAQAATMHAITTPDPKEFALTAALIRHSVLGTAADAATDIVRLYGGIGYTWEHEAHLYCKRAVSNAALFGPSHESRQGLASGLHL